MLPIWAAFICEKVTTVIYVFKNNRSSVSENTSTKQQENVFDQRKGKHKNMKNVFKSKPLKSIHNIYQYSSKKMQRYTVYLYLETALHISGGTFSHHQERIELYIQHLVFFRPLLLPAAIAARSSNGLKNTRCCIYSCMRS
jgi:hypothetical protein